ncbi:MAG: hypothetical protein RIG62_28035 [Cyclobacteriaceae bacterium]
MKTYYEQRHELSIHTRHFGKASPNARLMYGVLLILFTLIMMVNTRINTGSSNQGRFDVPAKFTVAKQAFVSQHTTQSIATK